MVTLVLIGIHAAVLLARPQADGLRCAGLAATLVTRTGKHLAGRALQRYAVHRIANHVHMFRLQWQRL